MLFTKEPTVVLNAISEIIKAVIPMLLIFGILHWTDPQVGAVILVMNVVIGSLTTILTRAQVVSNDQANKLIATAVSLPAGTPVELVKAAQAQKDAQ